MPIGSFFVSPHLAPAFFHHDAAFLVPEHNGVFADFFHAEAAKNGEAVLSLELLHRNPAFLIPERNGIFADFLQAEAAKDGEAVLSLELLHHDAAFLVPERDAIFVDFLHAEAAKDGRIISFVDLPERRFARRVQLFLVLYVLHFHHEADLSVLATYKDVAAPLAGFDVRGHVPVRAGA